MTAAQTKHFSAQMFYTKFIRVEEDKKYNFT